MLASTSFTLGRVHCRRAAPPRRAGPGISEAPPSGKDAAGAAPAEAEERSQQEIDDAVLRMAVAMTEEEGQGKAEAAATPKEDEFEFDFQLVITAVLVALIIYSFGSAFIGIFSGRIQDRTGGDFTFYDFLDNIISFKEWNLEYTLGFDPFNPSNKS